MYKIYQWLPVFLQNFICSTYGYKEQKVRFNAHFFECLDSLIQSDMFKAKDIQSVKKRLLSSSLINAKASGCYPSLDIFDEVDIQDEPFKVLEKMPVLIKDDLRGFDLSSFKKIKNAQVVVTSGTTGKALEIVRNKKFSAIQWAVWFRHRARFGIKLGDVSVTFTGKPVVPINQTSPPFWRFNKAQNQYLISMQHININTIESIITFLNSIKPKFYSGYPSIISEISRLAAVKKLRIDVNSLPKAVFTGAEKLLADQEESIRSWLGNSVLITDQYGLTEGNCNFSKCEFGYYHEDFEFCHIEIIDGKLQPDGSIKGRLIGTSFHNDILPLVRFDTGDVATMAPESFTCECGRSSRVITYVDGRIDDFILLPNNQRVMRFDYLFKDTYEAVEAQIIQRELNSIEVVAVLVEGANKEVFENKVTAHFREYIHDELGINFTYTKKIKKTQNGKFKAVINKLELK